MGRGIKGEVGGQRYSCGVILKSNLGLKGILKNTGQEDPPQSSMSSDTQGGGACPWLTMAVTGSKPTNIRKEDHRPSVWSSLAGPQLIIAPPTLFLPESRVGELRRKNINFMRQKNMKINH